MMYERMSLVLVVVDGGDRQRQARRGGGGGHHCFVAGSCKENDDVGRHRLP